MVFPLSSSVLQKSHLVGSREVRWWDGDEKSRKRRLDDESVGVRAEGRVGDDGMGGWGSGRDSQGLEGRECGLTDEYWLSVGCTGIYIDLDWWQYILYKWIKNCTACWERCFLPFRYNADCGFSVPIVYSVYVRVLKVAATLQAQVWLSRVTEEEVSWQNQIRCCSEAEHAAECRWRRPCGQFKPFQAFANAAVSGATLEPTLATK